MLSLQACRIAHGGMRRSKKPWIGHNMTLDVALFMHHFVCELPSTLPQFRELMSETFPRVYDTKYVRARDCTGVDPHRLSGCW